MLNPITLEPVPTQFEEAAALNMAVFADYYKRLRLLALSLFEWENLPESMNERFLEQCLYWYGKAAIVNDDNLGIINTKCTPSESLNIYGEATEYHCYSTGYDADFPLDDMVYVRNNLEALPTDATIQLFAQRLYEAERTIDVNIKAQKTPVIILCDEKQRLTMKNIYMKYDGNEPVIYGKKGLDIDDIKVLRTDAPFVADKLEEYKRNVWSEALSFLGINNVMTEKKERLVTGEVDANNQMIDLSAQTMLLTRELAADKFNRLWPGRNISVRQRSYQEIIKRLGGGDNGSVYNGTEETD
jgi:hypothetical protein